MAGLLVGSSSVVGSGCTLMLEGIALILMASVRSLGLLLDEQMAAVDCVVFDLI